MKILVPLDGSSKSESILPMVDQLAGRWQAEVIALRVLDPTFGAAADPLVITVSESAYQKLLDEAREYLASLSVRYPKIIMRGVYEVGDPGCCIQDVARKEGCDMIIMASHGHTGFVRWIWGSVAEGVARHALCPTMLVRSQKTPMAFREILIPTDGSEPSLQVAQHIGMFVSPDTKVTLLHCTGVSEQQLAESMELRATVAETRNRLRQHVDGRPWMKLECVSAAAPQGIYAWLAEHDCDLIAMFSHARDGLAHLMKGSLMEEIARHSDCPVLVFPPVTLNPDLNEEVAHANL